MFDEAQPRPPQTSHALMQDPAFAAALRMCGQDPLTLPSGQLVLQRRFFAGRVLMLPRACPPADLADQLRAIGAAHCPVILSPPERCAMPKALRLRAPQELAVLDLGGSAEACHARLHGKWRNQLTAAEKHGLRLECVPFDANLHANVLRTEQKQARMRGYQHWPAALTAAFAAVAPEQTHLFRALHKSEVVAHMLFMTHGTAAAYHIGHITAAGKALCAHNYLLWHAARRLGNAGFQTLDLGLLTPRTAGLNRFKLRTGARQVRTGGTWLYWRPFS